MASIWAIIQPQKEMIGEASEAHAKAEETPTPCESYLTPDYPARPCPPRMSVHVADRSSWRPRVSTVPGRHDISCQMRIRRHLRAWGPFGGVASQLSHLAVVIFARGHGGLFMRHIILP